MTRISQKFLDAIQKNDDARLVLLIKKHRKALPEHIILLDLMRKVLASPSPTVASLKMLQEGWMLFLKKDALTTLHHKIASAHSSTVLLSLLLRLRDERVSKEDTECDIALANDTSSKVYHSVTSPKHRSPHEDTFKYLLLAIRRPHRMAMMLQGLPDLIEKTRRRLAGSTHLLEEVIRRVQV